MKYLLEAVEAGIAIELTEEQYNDLPRDFAEQWKNSGRLTEREASLSLVVEEARPFLVLYNDDGPACMTALRGHSEDLKHFVSAFGDKQEKEVSVAPDEDPPEQYPEDIALEEFARVTSVVRSEMKRMGYNDACYLSRAGYMNNWTRAVIKELKSRYCGEQSSEAPTLIEPILSELTMGPSENSFDKVNALRLLLKESDMLPAQNVIIRKKIMYLVDKM